jgi:glutamate N-acetyltransferase/amino-acid N-acetyltransferase
MMSKEIMKVQYEHYTYIDGGVCAAKGYRANGLHCGLNSEPNKNDLGILVSDVLCNAAAVYTSNKVKGAPIVVTKEHLEKTGGKLRGVIMNSKNANTCNADGVKKAEKMCELAADKLQIRKEEMAVASTGVIGQILPIEPIEQHIMPLIEGMSYEGNLAAEWAIMTTDTVPKEVAVSFELDGKECHLGGMAKGSGMIHPNMATTLNFITTDVAISSELLQKALNEIVKITYNCLSVDGDTSTNDMVLIMANGMTEIPTIVSEDERFETVKQALYIVMSNLTKMLAKDGEGATKLLECHCMGAKDLDTAITVAKSVICSPLFKCAMFGEDANWGRVLCAIGYADAEFDINKVDVTLMSAKGRLEVCKNGSGVEFSEDFAKEVLSEDEITILVQLAEGNIEAKAWGCDLTYDYVKINGDYRS